MEHLKLIRYCFICLAIGFVAYGWYRTLHKYTAYKTAISIHLKKHEVFKYPSITICPGFKNNASIWHMLMEGENFKEILRDISYERHEFLTLLSHPGPGDESGPTLKNNIIGNDSLWTQTIPHVWLSGVCHTYDPYFMS